MKMTTNAVLITLALMVAMGSLLAGQVKKTVANWLVDKHAQLASVKDPNSIRRVALDQSAEPNKEGFFSMHPKNGHIEFSDGSWVLLTSHSAHSEDGLPDISLIRTSTDEYYTNHGHCCLPILPFSKEKVDSLERFLKTTGKGPEAKITTWIKYNREQDGTGQPATRLESKSENRDKPQPEVEGRSR